MTFNIRTLNTPISTYNPGNRVIPGQFRRLGGVNSFGTTIIKNYNYNYQMPGFGMYGYQEQSSPGFWSKLLMGFGAGSTILGGLMSIFGRRPEADTTGRGDAQGTGNSDNTQSTTPTQPTTATAPTQPTTTTETTPTQQTAESTTSTTEVNPFAMIANNQVMSAINVTPGKTKHNTADIKGGLQNVKAGESKDAPKSFEIKDGKNTYKFELTTDTDANNKPIYKLTGSNISQFKQEEYTLVADSSSVGYHLERLHPTNLGVVHKQDNNQTES